MEPQRDVRPDRICLDSHPDELAGRSICQRRVSQHVGAALQPHMAGVRGVHDFGLGRWRRGRGSAFDAAAAREELGMSTFSEETKVIPRAARVMAALAYVLSVIGFGLLLRYSHDPGLQSTPEAGKLLLIFGPGLMLAIYVLLIGYVNGDAKRRGMRYVMWTLLAILIPNAIGVILYFILRDPPLKPCPRCAQI